MWFLQLRITESDINISFADLRSCFRGVNNKRYQNILSSLIMTTTRSPLLVFSLKLFSFQSQFLSYFRHYIAYLGFLGLFEFTITAMAFSTFRPRLFILIIIIGSDMFYCYFFSSSEWNNVYYIELGWNQDFWTNS